MTHLITTTLRHPWLIAAAFSISLLMGSGSLIAAMPYRYDHVVIVIEENTDYAQVLGDRVAAPYINELADGGVNFTEFYGITHPSQPNYIHLFSGDHQGIEDNNPPPGYPFSTPNLGAELISAGFSFGGYSEDLPFIGDRDTTGTDVIIGGTTYTLYRRKHNPWANWQAAADVTAVPENQVPFSVNMRFSDFPTDFSQLPTVSIVVPNQQNDMHDGTIRMGDDWLRANLSTYAEWAKTHNSLLVVTFDEDNLSGPNKIPTIFYGAGITPGLVNGTRWTLHNLLRTLEDMYGTTHAGRAAKVRPITGCLPGDPPVLSTRFRQGLNGYVGVADTMIRVSQPSTNLSASVTLSADADTDTGAAGNQPLQILLKFANLMGAGEGQIPANATIISAKLSLWTTSGVNSDSDDLASAHRVLIPWLGTDTWSSLTAGVSLDDVEAATADTFTQMPELLNAPVILDVTSDIAAFFSGATNHGWLIQLTGGDLWTAHSSESTSTTLRPTLQIAYTLPVAAGYASWQLGTFGTTPALGAPSDDPDGDALPNLVEYALNTQALLQTSGPLTVRQTEVEASGHTALSFTRNLDATDTQIILETSSDISSPWQALATWHPETQWAVAPADPTAPTIPAATVRDVGGHVTVTTPTTPVRQFYRISVSPTLPPAQ